MSTRDEVEAEIRQIIATESSAITLSNKLFSPSGLFNQLAQYEPDRRAVIRLPLFKQAQDRVWELQRQEIAEFVQSLPVGDPTTEGWLHKRERVEVD